MGKLYLLGAALVAALFIIGTWKAFKAEYHKAGAHGDR